MYMLCFFFFKQKTAYEMRISDWSSDVCSSDLSHRELEDAAERRRILLGELQHRVKNLLANVRALVKRTRATSSNLGEFAAALDARLVALARTQDLLTRGIESKISLRDILCQELEAHGALDREHVVLTGPDALLRSEEHTSELQSLMRNSYAVFCLKKKKI